jgi:RimJ/RimL family protein N-acetyltransferase
MPRPPAPLEPRLSLGWATDLIFARFDAEIIDRGDYLVVRTLHNPDFWWGNFLLFGAAPQAGEAAAWEATFDAEIARTLPQCRHLTFGIDAEGPVSLPADFGALGLTLSASTVLTQRAAQLRAPRRALAQGLTVRVLRLPEEAEAAVQLQVESDEGANEMPGYRVFRERQMARYAAMQNAGLGHWFGVFAPGPGREMLVADCGLFRDRDAPLARFQHVETHPSWRRRGLCSALVHAVCKFGYAQMGVQTLVMVADPADVAIGIYETLGFERGRSTWQLERGPRPCAAQTPEAQTSIE